MKKKGLSPIIATVLLIALVLVLAMIVFLWARGFISEKVEKGGVSAENACNDVSFEIQKGNAVPNGIQVQVVNRGNVHIYAFEIKEIAGGSSTKSVFEMAVDKGGASDYQAITLKRDTEEVIFYPQVLGQVSGTNKNKAVTCLEKGQTIKV